MADQRVCTKSWTESGVNWKEARFIVPDGAKTLRTYAAVDGEQDLGSSDNAWNLFEDGLPWGIQGGIVMDTMSWAVLIMIRNGEMLKTREDRNFGSYNFRFPSQYSPEPDVIPAPPAGTEFVWKVGTANVLARQIGEMRMYVEVGY